MILECNHLVVYSLGHNTLKPKEFKNKIVFSNDNFYGNTGVKFETVRGIL